VAPESSAFVSGFTRGRQADGWRRLNATPRANGTPWRRESEPVGNAPIHVVEAWSPHAEEVTGLPGKRGSSLCKWLGRLRYKHLSLLVALDEHRNLHRAAKVVCLAQPSASKLVQDLELLFGSPLFDRLPTGMQPTELGTVVLAFARSALGDLSRLAAEVDHRQAGRDGDLVIGATTDLLPDVVAHAMTAIKQRRPTLAIELLDAPSDEIVNGLIEGRSDVVVGYFHGDPCRGEMSHREIDYETIGDEPICIVARQGHPLSHQASLSVYSLERIAWILHRGIASASEVFEEIFLPAGMQAPTNIAQSNSLTMTMNLLLASDAVALLPERVVCHALRAERLVRLPVTVANYSLDFGILTRRGGVSSAAVEFRELLLRRLALDAVAGQ
jgi:DNA-binding transcriptional LysR family regulator